MKVKMEYMIISGKVIETRRCYMSERTKHKKVRGQRKANSTSFNKIMLNEREGKRRLSRIMNTNFSDGFLHVVLKYQDDLPETYEDLEKNGSKFLRKARKVFGEEFKYVMVNANWSPKKGRPARYHHHVIMPIVSVDKLTELWPTGAFYVDRVTNPSDLTQLASYLYDNVSGLDQGKKRYSTSKNMDKPIFTEPKPVDEIESIEPIPETTIVDAEQTVDEDGFVCGSYMRAICHDRIKVRGGMVIMPKKTKKKVKTAAGYEAFEGGDEP